MNEVQPIRSQKKILAIKNYIKGPDYNKIYRERDYLLFIMGINCALRIHDLLALKVSDIITKEGNIKKYLHVNTTKTNKKLQIKINDSIKKALNYYLEHEKAIDPDDYLFKSNAGKKLDRIRAWGLVKDWTRAVGLTDENYGTHTLRKTWATMAVTNFNIPIRTISKKLGHKTIASTMDYIGITQREINDAEDLVCL